MEPARLPDESTYPPAPWNLVGQMWLSLFRVPVAVDDRRPAGIHGVAMVSYEPGSSLTYAELLVAHPAPAGSRTGRAVTISDIWVDSRASLAGGRELWAIPKELCRFTRHGPGPGPVARTAWSAAVDGAPIASATFDDASRLAVRLPFRGRTRQYREDGTEITAGLRGSARMLPCRGRWEFDPQGPLGWLAAARRLGSFRIRDFRLRFG